MKLKKSGRKYRMVADMKMIKNSKCIPLKWCNMVVLITFTCMILATSITHGLAATVITDCTDLQNIRNNLTGNYYLSNDIDCSGFDYGDGKGFMPIGNSTIKFDGTLDGKGYKITHLYINRSSMNEIALFGYTSSKCEIKDVRLNEVDITGNIYVGSFVGYSNGGTITNCYSNGSVNGNFDIGGLVGNKGVGTITNCYSNGSVNGNFDVGGLVGYSSGGIITNCYSTGSVSGTNAGGLVGYNSKEIINCYSTGSVSGSTAGGLVGYSVGGTVTNSYWDNQTSGQNSSAGGTGKTTVEMKQQATFENWDFENIWGIFKQTYPYLQWQYPTLTNDIYVNGSGWWYDGGAFNINSTPIQAAIDNANPGMIIYVYSDSYNENVNVNKQLTLKNKGMDTVTVTAALTSNHVFNVSADYVNISGFNVKGATGDWMAGIYLGSGVEHCNISNNNASGNDIGIYLDYADNNIFTNNIASNNEYEGFYLGNSSNNTLTSNTAGLNGDCGFILFDSDNNTLMSNNANSNTLIGIYLNSSNSNMLTSNNVNAHEECGIAIEYSGNNTFTDNNVSSNGNYGINLLNSGNNIFTGNNASDNSYWDINVENSSSIFTDNTLNDTTVSFTYSGDVSLKGVGSPSTDPSGHTSINKFINATNQSADAWLYLNFSYSDTDITGLEETGLTVWKYDGTSWLEDGWNEVQYLSTVDNIVGVNITDFGRISIFGPMAATTIPSLICVNETGWWKDGGAFNKNDTPIQAAIDNADPGIMVYVYNGSYKDNVNVNKQLTLQGEGMDVVTVTANLPSNHVFNVSADYVNISGFNVKGATDFWKAGIYLGSGAKHCNISNNNASGNDIGIFLDSSGYNTLISNTADSNSNYGFILFDSNNNILSRNNVNSNKYDGFCLESSKNNTLTSNTANSNGECGIDLSDSDNNILTNNTANSNDICGITVECSSNNTFTNNTGNSNGEYGIDLLDSSNNTFMGNTASDNINWDINIENATSKFADNTLNGTTVSFTYGGSVSLKGEGSPAVDPSGQNSINKFINATNQSTGAWLYLNFSYSDADVNGLVESSLAIWKYNGTSWLKSGWNVAWYLNTTGNVVGVNITDFSGSSVFAPMAPKAKSDSNNGGGGGGGSDEPENVEEAILLRMYLESGGSSKYDFNNVITSVEVTPIKTYGLVAAKIEVLKGRPASIFLNPPPGVIYKYVNIFVGNSGWSEGKFSDSIINFQVPVSWVEENDIDISSVIMYRYHNGEWQPLRTTMTGQVGGYYQYSSPTPGFSTFLILGQVEKPDTTIVPIVAIKSEVVADATPTPEPTQTEKNPGFGILFGIIGILMAVVYLKRKYD